MIVRAVIFCVVVAGAAATAGYAVVGAWQIGVIGAALAGLWLVALRRGWRGLPSLLFLGFILLAAAGVALPAAAFWAPLCLVAALAAWDLDRFAGRLAVVETASSAANHAEAGVAETAELERRHLLRLAVVAGIGLGLSWAGQAIQLKLNLTVMLILGFVAILALSRVVRLLARESD